MDLDQLPGLVKVAGLARMIDPGQFTVADVRSEIVKCELVCADCHRLRTATHTGVSVDDLASLAEDVA